MTVMHVNGFHHVWVVLCRCSPTLEDHKENNQLLDIGWFPATEVAPRTAFTFTCLDLFSKASDAGKLSVDGYYRTMCLVTDSTQTEEWPVRLLRFA